MTGPTTLRVAAVVAIATLAACSSDDTTGGGATTATPTIVTATSDPALDPTTTSSPTTIVPTTTVPTTTAPTSTTVPITATTPPGPTLVTGSADFRDYTVVVPSSYDGTAMPLVMMLHGYTASGVIQESYFRLGPLAEAREFLLVYPDGTFDPVGNRFWNATDACCNFTSAAVDDVAHLLSIIDAVSDEYAVDPDRVHLVGHSNGGFMSYRMACDHADVIASIVSLAGATFADPDDCQPSEPVGVVQVHGTLDTVISYDGGATPLGGVYPSATDTASAWARSNRCESGPEQGGERLDLDAGLDGADTSVTSFGGCPDGIAVELWTIEGGSHVPPLTDEFRERVIDALLNAPRPPRD